MEDIRQLTKNLSGGSYIVKDYVKSRKQSGMPLSKEYRVFIYAGKILVMDDYWDAEPVGKLSEDEICWIESIARRVQSNFVTVDLARKEDGSLIIMEFGDRQVSGLQQITAERFYGAIRNFETY